MSRILVDAKKIFFMDARYCMIRWDKANDQELAEVRSVRGGPAWVVDRPIRFPHSDAAIPTLTLPTAAHHSPLDMS